MKQRKMIVHLLIMVIILSGCSIFGSKYKEGVYEGEAFGYQGSERPIKISIAIDSDEKIKEIVILDQGETEEIGGKALKDLTSQVVNSDKSIDDIKIDAVSKATQTSKGFEMALKDALEKAKNKWYSIKD